VVEPVAPPSLEPPPPPLTLRCPRCCRPPP
jgi:hypothetical protein